MEIIPQSMKEVARISSYISIFISILAARVSLFNLLNISYADRINVLELAIFLKFLLFLKNFIRIFSQFFQVF